MVTDFKYEIMPHKYYDCDNTRTIGKRDDLARMKGDEYSSDPQPSSCYRILTIQFDERDEAIIPVRFAIVSFE